MSLPWLTFDDEERADAERVAMLEDTAEITDDPAAAAELLAEADGLRERWSRPRVRFASLEAMFAELQALAALAGAWNADEPLSSGYDVRALRDLGERASTVGVALETLADDLEGEG